MRVGLKKADGQNNRSTMENFLKHHGEYSWRQFVVGAASLEFRPTKVVLTSSSILDPVVVTIEATWRIFIGQFVVDAASLEFRPTEVVLTSSSLLDPVVCHCT